MTPTNREVSRPWPGHGPEPRLSAAEREVVERVKKQAGRQRESAVWRFGKNPPMFLWWLCW